jgi:ABC-type transport system involved in Fe-S cluster assembly fused permease/ATPase subunit
MLAGSFAGCKTMGLVNDTATFMEMQTCSGLATIYIYFIFQSDFVPCLIAVIIPALYYFYTKT